MPVLPLPTNKSPGATATPTPPPPESLSKDSEPVTISKPTGLEALHAAAENEAKLAKEKIKDWIQNQVMMSHTCISI